MSKISIDLMGGDYAPLSFIKALKLYYEDKTVEPAHFIVYGEQEAVEKACTEVDFSLDAHDIEFYHFPAMQRDQKPTSVLRQKYDTSLSAAIKAVAEKKAQVVLSGGDTGAYMILCMKLLGLSGELKRPVLLKPMLTLANKHVLILDVGANSDIREEDMWYLAKTGSKIYQQLYAIANPIVKLLNVGTEAYKGNLFLQKTAQFFEKRITNESHDINYQGFIEGSKMLTGEVEVIVCDGFNGNIAMKSFSGGMNFVLESIKNSSQLDLFEKVSTLVDPRRDNGAIFAGLKDAIAIKSHGNSDSLACFHALKLAISSSVAPGK